MKTLFVGGTFDPIHVGHIITARAAGEFLGFDNAVFVPSAMLDHKVGKTSFHHRFAMVEKAIEGDKFFSVSPVEYELTQQTGNSYTANVAVKLWEQSGCSFDQIDWMIGSDSITKAIKWKEPETLKRFVRFVIAERPGYEYDVMPFSTRGFFFVKADTPLIDLSSTHIRKRVSEGKSIRYLVPDSVSDYIFSNHLYVNRG